MTYVDAWLRAFVLTLAVEVPIATPLLGGVLSPPRRAQLCVAANLATHPMLWFVLPELLGDTFRLSSGWSRTLLAELWVCAVEAWIYAAARAAASARRACGVSVVANLASFLLGRLLWR